MPLDNLCPEKIVLGKDLKPGDCIRERRWPDITDKEDGNNMGIIVSTTLVLDKRGKKLKKFYVGHAYEIYDINCPNDGPYSTRLDPEQEFKVIRSRKDILYIYEKVEYSLLKRSADLMNQRNDLLDIKSNAIDRIDVLK